MEWLRYIQDHEEEEWSWKSLSFLPSLPIEFVVDNPSFDWDYTGVSRNQDCTYDLVVRLIDEVPWDWNEISNNDRFIKTMINIHSEDEDVIELLNNEKSWKRWFSLLNDRFKMRRREIWSSGEPVEPSSRTHLENIIIRHRIQGLSEKIVWFQLSRNQWIDPYVFLFNRDFDWNSDSLSKNPSFVKPNILERYRQDIPFSPKILTHTIFKQINADIHTNKNLENSPSNIELITMITALIVSTLLNLYIDKIRVNIV